MRARRIRATALPVTVSAAVSAAHLQRKFRLDGEPPSRVLAAAGAGTLMMSAYLGGRLSAGVASLARSGLRAAHGSGNPDGERT